MRKNYSYCIVLTALVVVVFLCSFMISTTANKNAFQTMPLPLPIPEGWPVPTGDIFKDNPPTVEGFLLGKKLFYDPALSSDNATSCGSCHQNFAAFSTFDHDFSHGVSDTLTSRNAPALFNLAWMNNFHWDGGVKNLEMQPINPITAKNEMGETLENVLTKIAADPSYKAFYQKAYGDTKVSSSRTLKALAQFVGQLVSSNSKYDRVKAGKDTLTRFEANGYEMFLQHCNTCHQEPLFTTNQFANNGIAMNRQGDRGRMDVTQNAADSLLFKIPSLRNIQLTFPYMHDGRFYGVDEAINHYISLDTSRKDIDPILKKKKIKMTPLQKNQLIYFLYTLTDTVFTKDKRFAPDGLINYKH